MTDPGPIDFKAKREEFLRRRAIENGEDPDLAVVPVGTKRPKPVEPVVVPQETPWAAADFIPEMNDENNRSEEDDELDQIIKRIDFPTAYNKWIKKSVAKGTKKDGNHVSCPLPNHPDKNPSAWYDERGLWTCPGCEDGGDVYDLAAIHFGYPRPGYKDGAMFHKLRRDMAESFGWVFKNVSGGEVIYQADEAATPETNPTVTPEMVAEARPAVETPDSPDNVSEMWAADEPEELVLYPTLDWANLIPEDTFLHEYMKMTTQDDSPEEYHFWHGLIGLGHAVGRKVTLSDHTPVYGNLMVCLMGSTGTGKSRSRRWLDTVLREATPYQEDGTSATGVKLVPLPGSGEYLVSAFNYEGRDPANNKRSLGPQPVNGIVDFDELSAMLARANRQGSSLKSTIMQFADCSTEVKIGSLTRGDIVATRPFCSIIASTQPKSMRNLLSASDTGSGFVNRWVFAGGKSKQMEVLGGSRAGFSISLDTAIEKLKYVHGWGGVERSIELDDTAYAAYVTYFREKIEPWKTNDDTDLLKRIDLLSKKLMLLLAINQKSVVVTLQMVEAMKVILEYVIECFGIVGGNIGGTLLQDIMVEIERHITRHKANTGRGCSARDLVKYTKRKNYGNEMIKKALDIMASLDLIELEKKSSNMGRPTARYHMTGSA